MSYAEPRDFEGKELSLIYVAGETAEAKSIESLLAEQEITYTLKPTPFLRHNLLFEGTAELPGVGFYVLSAQAKYCRNLLLKNKFKVGLVMEDKQ
jgi:hypothetical protein